MNVLDYLFLLCFTLFCSGLTSASFGQSADLFLSSDNNCEGQLEIGIYIQASPFSLFDFKIGSTSIFLDYDASVVQFYSYTENEFSANVGNSNGWLPHQYSYDDECGFYNLVLELNDSEMNNIYVSKQQATKIGVVNFIVNDPATDPKIAVRAEFSSVYGAGSNDGSTPIPIINIPQVLDYSCLLDCDVAPIISNIEVINEECINVGAGSLNMYVDDNPDRDSIEISINGGFNYEYTAAVAGYFTVPDLSSGNYDIWARWQNDQCPTQIASHYVGINDGPTVSVSVKNNCDPNEQASIIFEFPDQLPIIESLKFTIDAGITFSDLVADNTGSYTFDNLDIGQYHCYVSWGDGICLTNLGVLDITPPDYPTLTVRQYGHCYSSQELNGALFFDIVDDPVYADLLISLDNGVTFPYQVSDDIGTFAIYNYNHESFSVVAKWVSSQCSYYYGSGFFRYIPRDFNLTFEHSPEACDNLLNGVININLDSNSNPQATISIDGGQSFHNPTTGQNLYQFDNLGSGDYPIMVNWGDCVEFHSLISIEETQECPSCFDGVKNGDEVYVDCGGSSCIPCDECQTFLALNADHIDENILFQASDRIEIKGVVDENLNVDIKAANEILLKPQFEVSGNATFHAFIEECN